MTTIARLLEQKGHTVHAIAPDSTVYEAIRTMAERNVGALVVIEDDRLVGIVTERHYARNVFLKGKSSPTTLIREIMERHVVCARPNQSVEECMAVMTSRAVRHLPVLEGKRVVGIISIGDLVKSIIADQQFTIDQLVHFISS